MKTPLFLLLAALALALPLQAQDKFPSVGRSATPDEIAAWDIDVRADFTGLPKGAGSVKKGQQVWEAKCESCHGVFGESGEVFTPIVGGTTKKDIESGRVANLARADYPQRSSLMKLFELSTLWDYINRAMPWNAPKSLSVEEVYAVTAYILHLGDIVSADYVLSDKNIADVQKRLPNRNGGVKWLPMWEARGKGDVRNVACMSNCQQDMKAMAVFPDHARDSHGNLSEQSRVIGASRGIDTSQPPSTKPLVARVNNVAAGNVVAPSAKAAPVVATVAGLAQKYTCSACHAADRKLVGPSHADIAKKYVGDSKSVVYVMDKIKKGGSGVWGAIPMPPNSAIPEAELRQLAEWSLRGGRQ